MEFNAAVVAGGTGLIGRYLIRTLIEDSFYDVIVALTRRPLEVTAQKLEQRFVDFDRLTADDMVGATHLFCCLGTTMKAAGSREAFRRVDILVERHRVGLGENRPNRQYKEEGRHLHKFGEGLPEACLADHCFAGRCRAIWDFGVHCHSIFCTKVSLTARRLEGFSGLCKLLHQRRFAERQYTVANFHRDLVWPRMGLLPHWHGEMTHAAKPIM